MADLNLPFSPPANATGFINQLHYLNSLTDTGNGGILGILIILVTGAVCLLVSKAFQFEKGFAVSMTITSFIGILLGIMGLLSDKLIYLCLTFLIVSLFILFKGSDRQGF